MQMNEKAFLVLMACALILFSGCIQTSQTVCNPPYIQVGGGCCLDQDGNSVCDKDEQASTTIDAETSTIVTETTTHSATTTVAGMQATATGPATTSTSTLTTSTSVSAACSSSDDCPEQQEGRLRCDGDKIVKDVTTFYCANPGTNEAMCKGRVKMQAVKQCSGETSCLAGQCVDEYGETTTLSSNCAWTQAECDDYCLDSCSARGMTVSNCYLDEDSCRCSANCGIIVATTTAGTQTSTSTLEPAFCGNGIIEGGEQCELDADCGVYGFCGMNCQCNPDCHGYCGDQGVDGYQWINDGATGSPTITSSTACQNWAQQKLNQISQQCKVSCAASASYTQNNNYACCCADWNSIPCANCPGLNPVCPPTKDCEKTL